MFIRPLLNEYRRRTLNKEKNKMEKLVGFSGCNAQVSTF